MLADLAVESEASTLLAMTLASAFDRAANGDEQSRAYARLATAVAKYYVTKRAMGVVYEALECFGGNGYDEAWVMPRLLRQVCVWCVCVWMYVCIYVCMWGLSFAARGGGKGGGGGLNGRWAP